MKIIYDTIGKGYNSTRQADPYLTGRIHNFLEPAPGKKFLDIGCGTGNYTIALSSMGLNFTGVEPSAEMLTVARLRDKKINWLQGMAEQIPAEDKTFDGVVATLTIHHWTSLNRALNEIYRVTKTGGRIVVFTATPQQMKGYWLNYYFPGMLRTSIIQMPSFEQIAAALTNAGFKLTATEKYFVREDLQDHFLYSGKHKPEIYLNEDIRKGISSFATLANADEVKEGLLNLGRDFENGEFEMIKQGFENEAGDYLFIVAGKI